MPRYPFMMGMDEERPLPSTPQGAQGAVSKEDMDAMLATATTIAQRSAAEMQPPDTSKMKAPTQPELPPTELTDDQKQTLKFQTISEGLKNLAAMFPRARERFGEPPPVGAAIAKEESKIERNRIEARKLTNEFKERKRGFENELQALQIKFAMEQDAASAKGIADISTMMVENEMRHKGRMEEIAAQKAPTSFQKYGALLGHIAQETTSMEEREASNLLPLITSLTSAYDSIKEIDERFREISATPEGILEGDDLIAAEEWATREKDKVLENVEELKKLIEEQKKSFRSSKVYREGIGRIKEWTKAASEMGRRLEIPGELPSPITSWEQAAQAAEDELERR